MAEPPWLFRYKPPTRSQRWVTTHPVLWVGILIAACTMPGLVNNMSAGDWGFQAAFFGSIAAFLAVGSAVSLVIVRRQIRRYDAWVRTASESEPNAGP